MEQGDVFPQANIRCKLTCWGGNSTSPLIVYIPLVLENSNTVTSFLLAKTDNGQTQIRLYRGTEYESYGFDSTVQGNAKDVTAQLITLQHNTFGTDSFLINDIRVFQKYNPKNLKELKVIFQDDPTSNYFEVSTTTRIIGRHCGGTQQGCSPTRCDYCFERCATYVDEYVYTWVSDEGPTGPGDPGGGGTGFGGFDPGDGPGNPCGNTIFDGQPPPGCGGTGQLPATGLEGGTPGNPDNDLNQCQYVNKLVATPFFQTMVNKLRDSCINNYEIGYVYRSPLAPTPSDFYYSGQSIAGSTKLAVEIGWSGVRDGVAHNHNDDTKRLSIFSAEDLYKLYKYFDGAKIADGTQFTFVLVTNQTSYIIMIEDVLAFVQFGQIWLKNKKTFGAFTRFIYSDLPDINHSGVHQDSTNAVNEKNFLYNLKNVPLGGGLTAKSGIKVFRGNANMTEFTPITVDANKIIAANPCNL